jgi:hypothetical protein
MNKKNKKVLLALTLVVAVAVAGLVTVMGGPINPTDGVQTFISLFK